MPVVGGKRALRIEGTVTRPVDFGGGEVLLLVRSSAKAFVHFNSDPANPPR